MRATMTLTRLLGTDYQTTYSYDFNCGIHLFVCNVCCFPHPLSYEAIWVPRYTRMVALLQASSGGETSLILCWRKRDGCTRCTGCLRQTRRSNTACLAEAAASGMEAVFAPPPTEQTVAVAATRGYTQETCGTFVWHHTHAVQQVSQSDSAVVPHTHTHHTHTHVPHTSACDK